MIKCKDISKRYGTLEVLHNISCEIRNGEITAIVGPSGAGKTTLLQILGTLCSPERGGSVEYDGEVVSKLPDKTLSRFRARNIGFVFQTHRLLPEFTIEENVAIPGLLIGLKRREAFEKARELLERVGLGHRLLHKPSELSGGESQRAAVARALMNSPKVIFADEPTGSLDSHNRMELQNLFYELRKTMGATFVIVTHDESLAKGADRIIHMSDGKITHIEENQNNNIENV